MDRAFAEREEISTGLKAAGFLYVALDLDGYKSGSLNAVLNKPGKKAKKILPVIR
jgi:PP-loop superfamily ATP-utilizing enzyme